MSDIAMSKTAYKSYHLSLGHGDRSITDQGDGAETVNSGVVASPGARRSIVFRSCRLRGDIEKDGRKVSEASVVAQVYERSLDQPLWDEPWKIGAIGVNLTNFNLFVSPVAFQQLWEMADAPKNEQFDVGISGQVDPNGVLYVYEIILRPRSRTHSVAHELHRMRQGVDLLGWLLAALLVIELISWLWR